MKFLLQVVDAVNDSVGRIASFLIIPIIGILVFEVIARYGFNSPTEWSFESTAFLFFGYTLLAGGYTLLHGEHVNTDVIYNRFPLRTRAIVDLVTALLFFFFSGVLLWAGTKFAWAATELRRHSGTPWNPPMYIVSWLLPIGAGLLLIQGIAKFVRDLSTSISGREDKRREP